MAPPGMAQRHVAFHGMASRGMALRGIVWHGVAWGRGGASDEAAWHLTAPCGIAWRHVASHGAVCHRLASRHRPAMPVPAGAAVSLPPAPPPTCRCPPRLLPPSSRSFVLRDLAAGRQYDLCVSALYAEGAAALPTPRALGCVRFATPGEAPACAALPRPHFLGGTVIIVIGAAIAASVLVFILILTARYKAAAAARRPPAAVASVCSQTNGTHRTPEPEPPPPPLPPAPPALPPPAPMGAGGLGARGLFPSHSYPRRARTRRHGSLPRLDLPEGTPTLRPSFGSTHWMLESTV